MHGQKVSALFVGALFAASVLAQNQEPAGRILWSFGAVERVAADGVAKPLAKGDAVFEGDLIRSADGAHAQLIMSDEALIAVRSGSSVRLTQYRYGGREDGSERAVIELVKGGLRSVTGAIGRTNKDHYQLKNETHVIGIRGTDHETFATAQGTYNRVTLGGTVLKSDAGSVELEPGETGFVSMRLGAAPSRLERTPEFMHVAAAHSGNTGPKLRGRALEDDRRLQKSIAKPAAAAPVASTVAPAQTLGEGRAWDRNKGRNKDKENKNKKKDD